MELDTIHHTDLLTLCSMCDPQSIDMILCDLPYGTTTCSWDEIIPFEPMWAAFKRVIKPRGAIVLTSSQPFTTKLIASNFEMFKYCYAWEKTTVTGFMHAKNAPLKAHEDVAVFSNGIIAHANQSSRRMSYYPQMQKGLPYFKKNDGTHLIWNNMERPSTAKNYVNDNKGERFPTSVIDIHAGNHGSLHPTQKPVALFEYLIRTYTQAGEVVLDCCMGSGTTAIAARQCGRHFVGCDKDAGYVEVARCRLAQPWQPMLLEFA